MKPLFTEQEYNVAHRTALLPLECHQCHQKFLKSKHDIGKARNGNRYTQEECSYCSKECGDLEFRAKFEKTVFGVYK